MSYLVVLVGYACYGQDMRTLIDFCLRKVHTLMEDDQVVVRGCSCAEWSLIPDGHCVYSLTVKPILKPHVNICLWNREDERDLRMADDFSSSCPSVEHESVSESSAANGEKGI